MSDDDDFAAFAHARSRTLHRAAYLMVGDPGLAQDLVQEALVRTYAAWPRIRDKSRAEAYCRKAITTTALSWFRRRAWHERPAAELVDGESGAAGVAGVAGPARRQRTYGRDAGHDAGHDSRVAQSDLLWQALATLPPRQRVAVVLRYYEDLSERQTAEAMGCAVGTVKSQVSAGLARLRTLLPEADPDLLPTLSPGSGRPTTVVAR